MKKNSILKIVNTILAIVLLSQVITGFSHERLPEEVFEALHVTGGIVLAGLAVFHLILNWNWVKANFFRKFPSAGN